MPNKQAPSAVFVSRRESADVNTRSPLFFLIFSYQKKIKGNNGRCMETGEEKKNLFSRTPMFLTTYICFSGKVPVKRASSLSTKKKKKWRDDGEPTAPLPRVGAPLNSFQPSCLFVSYKHEPSCSLIIWRPIWSKGKWKECFFFFLNDINNITNRNIQKRARRIVFKGYHFNDFLSASYIMHERRRWKVEITLIKERKKELGIINLATRRLNSIQYAAPFFNDTTTRGVVGWIKRKNQLNFDEMNKFHTTFRVTQGKAAGSPWWITRRNCPGSFYQTFRLYTKGADISLSKRLSRCWLRIPPRLILESIQLE